MLTQGSAKHVASIRRIVVHEYYNTHTFDYDIALLQLKKPWPSSSSSDPSVQPVCLPPPSHTVTGRHRCWVTGWGYRSEEGQRSLLLEGCFLTRALLVIKADIFQIKCCLRCCRKQRCPS